MLGPGTQLGPYEITGALGAGGMGEVYRARRVTHEAGFSEWPTWSPDGRVMAFSSNRTGNFEIYVRRVDGGEEINVTNDPADDIQPAFSPDGASLAFVSTRMSRVPIIRIGGILGFTFRTSGGDVWVIPAFGGLARRIAERGNFPIWQPDGRGVTYVSGREGHRSVLSATPEGERAGSLLSDDRPGSGWEITRIAYAPGGRWLSFESSDQQIRLVATDGGDPRLLVGGSSHTWDRAARRLYYVAANSAATRVESVQFDETNGSVSTPVTVGLTTGLLHDLAIGPDGAQLLAAERDESLNLSRLALNRDATRPVGLEEELSQGQVRDEFPAYSPDGGRIAISSNRLGTEDLWILELKTTRWQRVPMPAGSSVANTPGWAPDGGHVAIGRFEADRTESLWLVATDGSSARQIIGGKLPRPEPAAFFCKFSSDGRTLLYTSIVGGYSQILALDLSNNRERQITVSPSDKYDPAWSPDGQWIAYTSNAGGSVQLWRVPAAGGREEQLTSGEERMRHVFYSPDGQWIYVQASHRNIFRLPSSGGPLQKVTDFPESGLFIEEPTISPDGRYLAYSRSHGGSSLWLLTLGSAGAESR